MNFFSDLILVFLGLFFLKKLLSKNYFYIEKKIIQLPVERVNWFIVGGLAKSFSIAVLNTRLKQKITLM
jgi:hypothetical protein